MQLSRALFVLPTLFTLSSVLMGMISLVSAAEGDFRLAALAILFAILFDSIDGRVARLTRTQSKFGIQIDSLADVVSFGVAPAMLAYAALLKDRFMLGTLDAGFLAAFLFVAAGALRLARYNVDAERKTGPVKTFIGLPIPGAAGCVAGLVLGLAREEAMVSATAAVLFLLLLAFLMVSTVRYRKKLELTAPDTLLLLALMAGTLVAVALMRPAWLVFALFAFYVLAGLAGSTLRITLSIGRRVRPNKRAWVDENGDRDMP